MNAHVPRFSGETAAPVPPKPEPKTEFVLGSLRSAIIHMDQIRQELLNAGIALKAGYITPQQALDWAEQWAPGCVGYVPPLSGLGLKRESSEKAAG